MTQDERGRHCVVDFADEGIATLTIANAGALNILGTAAIEDLTRGIESLRERPDLGALVMRGTGDKAFIGGADIKEMAALTRATAETFITGLRRLCDALRHFPAPVIARMPGWSLGGGLEVALACDIRIASDDAHFGMPEIKVGIPSVIHAALMPRRIGNAAAAADQGARSLVGGWKRTTPSNPRSRTRSRTAGSSGPSPTTCTRSRGAAAAARPITSTINSGSFCSTSRPG